MMLARLHVILLALLLLAPLQLLAGDVEYGSNEKAGQFAELGDIKMYYETYGEGEPLLLIHGNGQSVSDMHFQIAYFASDYQVIVADSRAHGKTSVGNPPLNYVQMMEDYNALLEQLGVTGANVVGWSDGGIVALLLAYHHPDKVSKLAILGANLFPGLFAIEPWVP
jgi:pimeloyl-ACP methyl ester carboxylesterase